MKAPLSLSSSKLTFTWLWRSSEDDNLYLDPSQVFSLRSPSDAFADVFERDAWFSTKALRLFWGKSISSPPAKVHVHVGIVVVVVIIVVVIIIKVVVAVDII